MASHLEVLENLTSLGYDAKRYLMKTQKDLQFINRLREEMNQRE